MGAIWPFAPNWRLAPFVVQREYRTEIITSRSGREQRAARRQTPRKRIEYIAVQSDDCLRAFDSSMVTAQRTQLVIADRPRFVVPPTGVGAGDDFLIVDSVPIWIEIGAELVLVSGNRHAIRTVNAIAPVTGGTKITFDESEALAWPAGTRLHPGLSGYLDAAISAPKLSRRGIVEVNVIFHVDPGLETVEDTGFNAVVYDDRELFLTQPNAWERVDLRRVQDGTSPVDYGFGRIRRFFPVGFSARIWRATYTGCDFERSDELRQFFDRRKGRRGEFYMPTFQADVIPTAALTTAGTSMTVAGADVAATFNGSTVFKSLAVLLNNGTWITRPISSIVAASGDVSVINVGSSWGQDVALADIRMVCWLPLWRFASDIMTTIWLTEDAAEASMAFQMIETFPAEIGDGFMAATEQPDIAAFAGTVSGGYMAAAESPDIAAFSGAVT